MTKFDPLLSQEALMQAPTSNPVINEDTAT